VPQADPNTASQTQRLLKVAALKQLVSTNPTLYNPIAVDMAALQALGWSNPQQFMIPPAAQAVPPPELIQAQQKLANETSDSQARMMDSQTRAQQAQADIALAMARAQETASKSGGVMPNGLSSPQDQIKLQEMNLQKQELDQKQQDAILDAINRKRDRESRERLAAMKYAETAMQNPQALGVGQQIVRPDMLQRLESTEEPLQPTPQGTLE